MALTYIDDSVDTITSGGGEQDLTQVTSAANTVYVMAVDLTNLVGVEACTISAYLDIGTGLVLLSEDLVTNGTDPLMLVLPPLPSLEGLDVKWTATPSGYGANRQLHWVLCSL